MSILRQDLKFNGMIDGCVSDGGMGGGGGAAAAPSVFLFLTR